MQICPKLILGIAGSSILFIWNGRELYLPIYDIWYDVWRVFLIE